LSCSFVIQGGNFGDDFYSYDQLTSSCGVLAGIDMEQGEVAVFLRHLWGHCFLEVNGLIGHGKIFLLLSVNLVILLSWAESLELGSISEHGSIRWGSWLSLLNFSSYFLKVQESTPTVATNFMKLGFSMKVTHLSPVQYWFFESKRQVYINKWNGKMLIKLD